LWQIRPDCKRRRAHDNDCRGKWRGILSVAKLQTPAQKAYLVFHGEPVPPGRVRAGRDKTNNGRSFMHRGFVSFGHPVRDFITIGRIHENDLVAPGLLQAVVFPREMPGAFRIGMVRTGIKRKPEPFVEGIKQPLWGWPPEQASQPFPVGPLVITPNALHRLPGCEVVDALRSHTRGDLGDFAESFNPRKPISTGDQLFRHSVRMLVPKVAIVPHNRIGPV
jgi:hypothetical protein